MSYLRWIPTFFAFPLAGVLAMLVIGPVRDPLTALAAGMIVGAVVGLAQRLALGRAVTWWWVGATALTAGVGAAVGAASVGPPTSAMPAAVSGAVAGLLVGAVQGLLLRRGLRSAGLWTITVGVSWVGAWAITSLVIVDMDRGHAVFGSSGAVVATLVTGLVLRALLGARPRAAATTTATASTPVDTTTSQRG